MKVSPLMICRTKYVDYHNPVFCAASNLNEDLQKRLHDIIINGNNLKFADECKVFISDSTHVVIGKVMYIKKLNLSLDDSLDKETLGRSAWGFIGGSINRSEYVNAGQLLDLPDDYYKNVYIHYLYNNHWLEDKFQGPYIYNPLDVHMMLLDDASEPFVENIVPIYPDKLNNTIFCIAIKKTLKGENTSFCSNEEFNAATAINKKALTLATVSDSNIKEQVEALKKSVTLPPSSPNTPLDQPQNDSQFIDELNDLCMKYHYHRPYKKSFKQDGYILSGFFIETAYEVIPKEKNFIGKIFGR